MEITCVNGVMHVGNLQVRAEPPAAILRPLLASYKSPRFDYLPPFTDGPVGYFSYDSIRYSEPAAAVPVEDTETFQDIDLMLFDEVIAFYHFRQKIILIANMSLQDPEPDYDKAVTELKQIRDLLRYGEKKWEPGGHLHRLWCHDYLH